MIYAKKKKFRTSVKAQQPRYSQRSSSSTRSAMINTQGNTSQGRATSKKNTQERVREAGGKSKNKNKNQKNTPKPKRKKKNIFSSLLPHPDGWKHLPGFATRGSAACWRALYVPLCGCTIPPRGGLPNGARKMSFG